MLASFGAQVLQLLIDLASSGNSAAAGARRSRRYGPGRSFGLLRSIWVDSWVHPEGNSGLNRMPKRSLINELLLSRTPTVEVTFILKHFRARRNPFFLFSVITVQKSLETGAVCASPTAKLEDPSFLARVVFVEDSKTERPFFIRAAPCPSLKRARGSQTGFLVKVRREENPATLRGCKRLGRGLCPPARSVLRRVPRR